MSLLFIEFQWNGLLQLRVKRVVLHDTWHHLTSHPTENKTFDKYKQKCKCKRYSNFVLKITLMQKLQNIIDINRCKKVLHRLYVSCIKKQVLSKKCVGNSPKIYDIKSKNSHKICSQIAVPLSTGMYELPLEWPIRILEITTWSLRLKLKVYGMLTLFWIE